MLRTKAEAADGDPAPAAARPRWPHRAAVGVVAAVALGGLVAVAWPSTDAETLWKEARAEFEARRFDRAEALMRRVGKLRAPTPLDSTLRAQLAMAADRNEEALVDLARVPDDHPIAPQARLQAGQIELRRNRFVAAEALFLRALAIDPRRVQARRELIYIYGMQLRRPELNAAFRVLAEQAQLTYPEAFLWCLARGVTWEAAEIVETLSRCLAADPADRWARLGKAEGLRELSRLDDAEATLAPLPESDPDARAARVRLALARGDDDAAEALLAGGPADHLGLALLRGQLALARNDGPGALRHFRVAYERAPERREAVFGLGKAFQLTGDADAAAPYLEAARKQDRLATLVQKAAIVANRDDPALVHDLGAACAAIGRLPEARAWYELAIARDPGDAKAQEGLARLGDAKASPPSW